MKLPPNARMHGDGSITFPRRGNPPNSIGLPNYNQDPDDPYRWIPQYCACQHRTIGKKVPCSLGRFRTVDYCEKKNITVLPLFCNNDCMEIDKK